MSSRTAAKKMVKPAQKSAPKIAKLAKPAPKAANKPAQKPKAKLAKVAQFPGKKKPEVGKKAGEPQPAPHRPLPAVAALPPSRLPPSTKQTLARSFYWSELRVGDDLPPLQKPAIDRVQIVRYSTAANDFNRLHLDEPFAHSLGFPGTFSPGMLAMGYVGQLLAGWLRRGHVRRLAAKFVKIVWPGDELTCRGRIADLRKEGGACYADVELWAENQKGELVLRGHATCELYESPSIGTTDSGGGLLFALGQSTPVDARVGIANKPTPTKPPPPSGKKR